MKKKIKYLLQWARDAIIVGHDPDMALFYISQIITILRTYQTNKSWVIKALEKERTEKPKQVAEETKWMDWKDYFDKFICTQPGRNGLILKYVIRED